MKKLFSFILAFALIFAAFDNIALASGNPAIGGDASVEPVTVYFSLSHDDKFIEGKGNGEVLALKKVTVPYFDLELYGLENFYFSSEEYGPSAGYVPDEPGAPSSDINPGTKEWAYGKITMMHLYIYALEVFYCGIDPEDAGKGYLSQAGEIGTDTLTITGSAGSSYMQNVWGMDENLNYYLNYCYPLASEGWGSTSDQILLHDGDIVTLGHFTSWAFYGDPNSVFNHLTVGNYNEYKNITVTKGETLTLTGYRDGANMADNDYNTAHEVLSYGPSVFYTTYDEETGVSSGDVESWEHIGSLDENGNIEIDTAAWKTGKYMIAMPGQYGQTETDSICAAPGGILIEVVEATETLLGDANEDGVVDMTDAMLVAAYFNETAELSQSQLINSDVNGDNAVDLVDAMLIAAYFNETIDEF